MRFAVKTRPEHQTWEEIRDAWIAADEIPLFESAWNWDHFYPLTGDLTGPNFEAWTMLAALAQATRRIRLGCQVTGMVYRHPAVLANMAATVDTSPAGVWKSAWAPAWNQMECDAYGIDLPPLRERFDRFDEGVEAIVSLLSQTTTTFAGQYVKLTDARCEPKPVQRPHPPVTIGGRGKKRTLRTVARWAQQWNAIVPDPGEWQELKEVLAGHCVATRARRERDHLLGQRAHRPGYGLGARRRRGNRLSRRRRRPGHREPAAPRQARFTAAAGRGAVAAGVSTPGLIRAGARAGRGWRWPSAAARRAR